jgi:hypothetical protein
MRNFRLFSMLLIAWILYIVCAYYFINVDSIIVFIGVLSAFSVFYTFG